MAMQGVINTVKGHALGVAEYLTPVLKVSSLLCLALARLQPTQVTNSLVLELSKRKHSIATWEKITSAVCSALQLAPGSVISASLRWSFQEVKVHRGKLYRHRTRKGREGILESFLSAQYSPPKKKRRSTEAQSRAQSSPPAPPRKRLEHDCEQAELNYKLLLHDHTVAFSTLSRKEKELATATKKNSSLGRVNQELKKANDSLKQKVAKYCPKRQNSKLARKEKACHNWKQKYRELKKQDKQRNRDKQTDKEKEKSPSQQGSIAAKCRAQKYRHKQLLKKLKHAKSLLREKNIKTDSLKNLMQGLKQANERIQFLENQLMLMEEKIKNKKQEQCCAPLLIQTKAADGAYTEQTRKCVYHCLESQVPVDKAGDLMDYIVRTVTPHQLDSTPSTSTVCRAAREMASLSDVQVGEALVTQENNTLGWDATCIDGTHINEVHVCTKTGSLMLGVSELPGGKTDDYHLNITEQISDVTQAYSECKRTNPRQVLTQVQDNISNTISDRVAVNHCVVQRLEGTFGKKLNELNCNVHPLDGLASKSRQVLKTHDKATSQKGACFGKECCTVNTIRAFCKLRYKASTGDPSGFKHFMKLHKITTRLLPRYVGNRMHIMFHLGGVIFTHRSLFLTYLEKFCPTDNGLRRSLLQDLGDKSIVNQLQILGLFGKLLTGPWMTKFYGNKENHSNLEMTRYVRESLDALRAIQGDPGLLYLSQKDAFGEPLKDESGEPVEDLILEGLHKDSPDPADRPRAHDVTSSLAAGHVELLERQLRRYLDGELSEPSESLLEACKSAPTHNIYAEQVLGMVDSQFHRAPNAASDFIDAKVKFRKNQTLEWLDNQESESQQHLLKFARKHARKQQLVKKERDKRNKEAKQEKLNAAYKRRDAANKNKMERAIAGLLKKRVELEDIVSAPPDLDLEVHEKICPLIQSPASVVGHRISHLWYNDGQEDYYCGEITKLKKNKNPPTYVIGYWQGTEESYDAVDYDIQVKQVVADMIHGDLEFLQ